MGGKEKEERGGREGHSFSFLPRPSIRGGIDKRDGEEKEGSGRGS